MDQATLLRRIAEALDHDGELRPGQSLDDLETWDSLGRLALVSLFEDLGVPGDLRALAVARTTDDLLALAAPLHA